MGGAHAHVPIPIPAHILRRDIIMPMPLLIFLSFPLP